MLKGVVFDLDGTLVDSLDLTFDAFNHGIVCEGGRTHTPQEISRHFGLGELNIFSQIIGTEKSQTAYAACRDFFSENLERAPLHNGIQEMLEHFMKLGVPVAIFTGRGKETTEILLNHHGWNDHFAAVITDDDVEESKPAPEGLARACKALGVQPQEVLYIGDSSVDILAARAAGARSVAALWDARVDQSQLGIYTPDFQAHHPSEIVRIWKKLN